MFDRIFPVLQEFGGRLGKDDWRRLVDYQFSDQRHRGWVSEENGEVVGYLGAIFSRRDEARFCSLTSWIVKKGHRKANLRLLAPMLELKDHTILNYSASPFTCGLFKKLGFEVLDEKLLLIPPVTPRIGPRGYHRVFEPELAWALDEGQVRMLDDHRPYGLTHVVLDGPSGPLWVAASKTTFRGMPVSFVHHVSRPELFAQLVNRVQRELFLEHRTLLTLVDSRLLADVRVRGALRYRLAQPRLYRPGGAKPTAPIDSLYTELAVLNPARWTFNY